MLVPPAVGSRIGSRLCLDVRGWAGAGLCLCLCDYRGQQSGGCGQGGGSGRTLEIRGLQGGGLKARNRWKDVAAARSNGRVSCSLVAGHLEAGGCKRRMVWPLKLGNKGSPPIVSYVRSLRIPIAPATRNTNIAVILIRSTTAAEIAHAWCGSLFCSPSKEGHSRMRLLVCHLSSPVEIVVDTSHAIHGWIDDHQG